MAQTVIGSTKSPVVKETILPESYKHSIIDSTYTPHTSFLSQVSGSPKLVEWYRGSYARDEEQHGFQPESIETYQSYKRINRLIVKMDDGNGNTNFDTERAEIGHSVYGYVLFDLAPGIGDLFITDIGDGRAGLYVLETQPEIARVHADKVYHFEAKLEAIVTAEIMENLNRKVIEELYYNKDIQIGGGNALLTKSDTDLNKELYQLQIGIIDDILANHYYNDEKTIVIPNDKGDLLYDPYLAKFLSNVFPKKYMGPREGITLLNVKYYSENRKQQEPLTVWDMFYRNGFKHPERYKHDYFTHERKSLMGTRAYGNAFFSKVDRIINIQEKGALRGPYEYSGALFPIGPTAGAGNGNVDGDPWNYFFGDDFYAGGGTEEQKFIWKMFRDKTVDKKELVETLNNFWQLDEVTKLYMSGIYVAAAKIGLLNTSSYT